MAIVKRQEDNLTILADMPMNFAQRMANIGATAVFHMVELWRYRELVRNMVIRDLKVRYRNSTLGILWSLGNPLLMMLVFTMVFTIMAPAGEGSIEKFPVFVLCGLMPWNMFSASIIGAIGSIVDNAPLVRKIYFPREILPISMVLANLINFAVALVVLFAFILVFRVPFTAWMLFLPVVMVVQTIFTIGVSLILATANVFYRDTQVIMEVLVMAWFFMTPIFYPISILPQSYVLMGLEINFQRWMYILNPMASLVATYRVILYGTGFGGAPPAFDFFLRTTLTALAVLVIGAAIFYRYSRVFGEEV
jgi:lipopolysaccharide transport system permease protein